MMEEEYERDGIDGLVNDMALDMQRILGGDSYYVRTCTQIYNLKKGKKPFIEP